MPRLAIVADDLTGAFDAAAPFAARGLATRVAIAPTALARLGGPCDVIALSTASRHLAPGEAASAVTAACRALAPLAPEIWLKKIDSTLRGNVAVELVAALAATGRGELVVTPATPSQGRRVIGGQVSVHGVALAATEFARDPVSPASPLPLAEQLAAADPALSCRVVTGAPPPRAGRCAWIADASSDGDLEAVAGWALGRAGSPLLAGAAGLATAIATALGDGRPPTTPLPGAAARPILYVVGSRTAISHRQAQALLARTDCDTPGGDALLHAPRQAGDPAAVAAALARSVVATLERRRFGALLVTGGDTLAAVLAALDAPLVTLAGEIAPGIPLARIDRRGSPLWLVSKAGGFGGDDLFTDLPRLLGAVL